MSEPQKHARSRPYNDEELIQILDAYLDKLLHDHPSIVAHTVLLLQLVNWLMTVKKEDGSLPEEMEVLLKAAQPVLASLLYTCERGPYDGLPVN